MTTRCVVTGATGFVGSALARRLVESGASVRALVRRSSAPDTVAWLRALGVATSPGDVTDAAALLAAFDGADVVYHAAAVIGYRRRLAGEMQRVNVLGTRRVVEACLRTGVGRLVHVSSIAAVGASREPAPLDEESPWNGGRFGAAYFDTKHDAEAEVAAGVAAGLDAVVVNPGAVYGASAAPSNSSRLVARIVRRPPPCVPPGGINAVPLETVVRGTLAAAVRGARGRRYILGGENLTYLHLVRKIGAAAGRELDPPVLPRAAGPVLRAVLATVEPLVPDRVWFTPDLCALFGWWLWFDDGRARRELGLQRDPLDAALRDAVAAVRAGRAGGVDRAG